MVGIQRIEVQALMPSVYQGNLMGINQQLLKLLTAITKTRFGHWVIKCNLKVYVSYLKPQTLYLASVGSTVELIT